MALETPSNGHASEEAGFGERIDHIGSTAQQLITEAKDVVEDIKGAVDLKGRVERHPYGMVVAALGVGYVLGGGLFTPLTARMLKFGLRLAALPIFKEELLGMAEQAFNQATGGGQGGEPGRQS